MDPITIIVALSPAEVRELKTKGIIVEHITGIPAPNEYNVSGKVTDLQQALIDVLGHDDAYEVCCEEEWFDQDAWDELEIL